MNPGKYPAEALLRDLGVGQGKAIYETVLSTCTIDGKPDAAPMGIQFVADEKKAGKRRVLIRPFRSTNTYKNLSSQGEAVVNVTSNPEVFYKTAFKRKLTGESEFKLSFRASRKVKPPRLKGCDAYLEIAVMEIVDDKEDEKNRSEVLCELRLVEVKKASAKLYWRAPYVLMEAMIHATRVEEFFSLGLTDKANELVGLIANYKELIRRIAPDSHYETLVNQLLTFVEGKRE
ncbi:MAG: DUF447 domain-containing protein [Candidatus Atabeyarchaeum deiterrae]